MSENKVPFLSTGVYRNATAECLGFNLLQHWRAFVKLLHMYRTGHPQVPRLMPVFAYPSMLMRAFVPHHIACVGMWAYARICIACAETPSHKAWSPLRHGHKQEALPMWIMPFRCTIRVRCGKGVRYIDFPDSTTEVCVSFAESPRNVQRFSREWCRMPQNLRIVANRPTGDAPTTSALSTVLLPTDVRLVLEVWR